MKPSKHLYRSRENRIIAGLCGGLADYFDIDVSIVRIGMIFVSLLPGPSIIFYLLAWVIVPEAPETPVTQS